DDERDLEAQLLGSRDDAVRDDVALHDAAEDVHEDALNSLRLEDDLEGLRDGLLRGAAADVEEVRRLAAEVLDGVHRRHREARAVDEAADVAVELDEAQTRRGGLGLRG